MRKAWLAAPALLLALTLSAQTGSTPSSGSQSGSAGQTSTSPSSTDQNQATPPSSTSPSGAQTSPSDQGATQGTQGTSDQGAAAGAQGNTGAAHGKHLPQTASPLPLLGLLGIGSLAAGLFQRRKR